MKVLLKGWWWWWGVGGGHTLERMNPPPEEEKKNPLVLEKEEEEEERGRGFVVMVYDLQDEPKMLLVFFVFFGACFRSRSRRC